MRKITRFAVLAALLSSALTYAQVNQTWVSGTGVDTNPCTRTAPCATFQWALSQTAAGGEIYVIDPGYYGVVTIDKAITIDGGGGQIAEVRAMFINAGPNDAVILRNLRFGQTEGYQNIVNFNSGQSLTIENSVVNAFYATAGIGFAPTSNSSTLVVRNTSVENGFTGIYVEGGVATIDNVQFNNNYTGLYTNTTADVRQSTAQGNGVAFYANTGANVNIVHSMIVNNRIGIQAAAKSLVSISDVTLLNNQTAVTAPPLSVLTYGDNVTGPLPIPYAVTVAKH